MFGFDFFNFDDRKLCTRFQKIYHSINYIGCLLCKNLEIQNTFRHSMPYIGAVRIILPVYEKYVDNDIDQVKKVTEE